MGRVRGNPQDARRECLDSFKRFVAFEGEQFFALADLGVRWEPAPETRFRLELTREGRDVKLVPDALIVRVIDERLNHDDVRSGVVLDGYQDVKVGDVLELFETKQVEQTLE